MQRAMSRAFRFAVVAGAALAALSCSKDDIPTTPPSPFLFTNVEVSKFVTPRSPVPHPRCRVRREFDVSYTLSAADDAQRSTLQVQAVVNSHDASGNFLAVIGSLAYTPPALTSARGWYFGFYWFHRPFLRRFFHFGRRRGRSPDTKHP